MERPTAVTVIGWTWLGLGGLILAGGLVLAAVFWSALAAPEVLPGAPPLPPEAGSSVAGLLLRAYPVALALLGVVSLVAAWAFLRRKWWARSVLEVLTWLALAYVAASLAVFLAVWLSGPLAPANLRGATLGDVPGILATVAVSSTYVLLLVPLAVMVRMLRSRTVREAMPEPERPEVQEAKAEAEEAEAEKAKVAPSDNANDDEARLRS
jgi:cation transport ATPase